MQIKQSMVSPCYWVVCVPILGALQYISRCFGHTKGSNLGSWHSRSSKAWGPWRGDAVQSAAL